MHDPTPRKVDASLTHALRPVELVPFPQAEWHITGAPLIQGSLKRPPLEKRRCCERSYPLFLYVSQQAEAEPYADRERSAGV